MTSLLSSFTYNHFFFKISRFELLMNFCVYMKFSTLLDIYFYCWWFVENALQVFHLKVMQFLCICRNKQVIWNWFVYVGTKIFTPYIWINVQFLCKCRNKESLVFICKNKYLGFSGRIDQENGKNISDCELKKDRSWSYEHLITLVKQHQIDEDRFSWNYWCESH